MDVWLLKKLDLFVCGLSASVGERIVVVLDENGCLLERLDFRGNVIGVEGMLVFVSVLCKMKMFKLLNLV